MRLFIATDPAENIKEELIYLSGLIKANSIRFSLTDEKNLHLTLCFIGESDDKDKIINALSRIQFAPFEVKLSHIGSFFRKGEHLVYTALEKTPGLMNLQKEITRELKKEGIDFDNKKFLPHITLARRVVFAEGYEPGNIKTMPVTAAVNSFELISSDLSGRRPVYSVVYTNRAK